MDHFRFEPELFSFRAEVIELLDSQGYVWLINFTSVDLLHDVFGLEVCGIPEKSDALKIRGLLRKLLKDWPYSRLCYRDESRDRGWKVVVFRDPERASGAFLET